MGENRNHNRRLPKIKIEPQYFFVFFSLVILLTFVIVFTRPVYPASLQATAAPTSEAIASTPQSTSENRVSPTPTNIPPTPEEIGYTDGIIFWATILVVILLVGTLRETLRRKGE